MRTGGGDALTFASEGGSEKGSDSDTSDWSNKVGGLSSSGCMQHKAEGWTLKPHLMDQILCVRRD